MAEGNALVLIFLVVIATPAPLAFSSRSWYCHRLAPRFITSAVTPCTYPCLVVSSHEHPNIIVQNEPDGTPCMIQNALHHGRKIGTCRNSVCVQELPHKVLNRKKRFICIYALARIIGLKKQRRKLQEEIRQLRQRLDDNHGGDVDNELAGRVGGDGSGGAEGFVGGISGHGAVSDYGPENIPSVGSGTGDAALAGRRGGGPEMRGVGPFAGGGGPNIEGGMGTAGVPHNPTYGGGRIGSAGDEAMDTTQVRLGNGDNMGGASDTGSGNSVGSTPERGGVDETAFYG